MDAISSFFSSLSTPSQTVRYSSSLIKEINRWENYLEKFDKNEFESDYILKADLIEIQDFKKLETMLTLRTLYHLQKIFNYLTILNEKLNELQNP